MRTIAFLLAGVAPLLAQTPQQLSAASGAGPRHPVVALDAEVVAWVAMAQGQRELFAATLDGSAPTRLTTGADVRIGFGTFDVWSPIGISDDGSRIAYWNAQGVHVLDRLAATDVVVATTDLLPMPRLDGQGRRVVYQAPVAGQLEVFLVDAQGGVAQQLTSNSGPGRRLPHLRGDKVVFQKLVGNQMELFVHDLAAGTTSGALTQNSGGGNRHAQLTPDADAIVFERVVAGVLRAHRLDLQGGGLTDIGGGGSGVRLPRGDGDEQVVLQAQGQAPEVGLADPVLTMQTAGSRGGHRLPGLDRHGRVLVWQQEQQGTLEVFVLRRCRPVDIAPYGSHGQPSVGSLASFVADWRCRKAAGLHTQYAAGTLALFAIGTRQDLPLDGAPGNRLWVVPAAWDWTPTDALGDAALWFQLSPVLLGATVHGQFAVLDPLANALGVVTSQGFEFTFR